MSRKAKPIETLLKLKQIKPDLVFEGADALAYQEFIEAQAEENLISTIRQTKKEKKTTRRKTTKKVKQTIDPEIVETGEVNPNETVYGPIAEEIQPKEDVE